MPFAIRLALCICAALFSLRVVAQVPEPPRFAIERFVVEGNSLIAPSEVDALLAPYTGAQRDFGDVQRALESLQETYQARGYTAVRVLLPEQELAAGQVRLLVIEAKIREIRVEGHRFSDPQAARASIASLREDTTPNLREIGRDVQLANENPARQVSVVLQATDQPGRIDAVLRVRDEDPRRFFVSLDNTGTSQTGSLRLGVGVQQANLGGGDGVLTAQYITSPTKLGDVSIFGVGLRLPHLPSHGIFDIYAGYSDVDSGVVQELFNVSGKGTVFGARYTHMLPRQGTLEQRASVGWDYRAYNNSVTLVGTTAGLIPDVTVHPVTLGYSARLQGVEDDTAFYGSFSVNLPGGNDGNQDAFTAQRAGARSSYRVVRYGAAYTRKLPAQMLVRAAFNGQYTRDRLIPGEQFGMGGAENVRGFFEREVSNDVGQRVSLELYSPDYGARIGDAWQARGLVFLDAATGYDRQPARGPDNGISSAGIGMRMSRGRDITLRLDLGHVLNAGGSRPSGKDRLHLAVVYAF